MTQLLSELHRERNGAAADAMRFYGKGCGLNLGVAIHTLRQIAASRPRDHQLAQHLYRQDIRELRIAALWIAEPKRVEPSSFDFWAAGIINSEIAEQAAMALFGRVACIDALIERWCRSEGVLAAYTALLSAARNAECDTVQTLAAIEKAIERFSDNRLIAQGSVAALAAIHAKAPQPVASTLRNIEKHPSPTATLVLEELSWRLAE